MGASPQTPFVLALFELQARVGMTGLLAFKNRKEQLTRSDPTLALVLTSSVSTKSTLFRTVNRENELNRTDFMTVTVGEKGVL